jgi:hypothetical protein
MRYLMWALVLGTLVLQGCATKTYGRQGKLTDYEKDTLTCRDIDLETAKVRGWIDGVNKESEFSGRDVLAILGDFGIGNAMERGSAMESANNRLDDLKALRQTRSCQPQPAV